MEEKIKIFLSYCHDSDYELAKEVKKSLEEYWFDIFLAHKSLMPGVEFDENLIENISTCDIFIPLLTNNFRDSLYTDQEIGIAVAQDKKIISLMTGNITSPHGFIKNKHAIKIDLSREELNPIINRICNSVYTMLSKEFKNSLFHSWKESKSLIQTKSLVKSFRLIHKLTRVEVEEILKGVFCNSNIGISLPAREYLRFLIKTYSEKINPKLMRDIEKFLNLKRYNNYLESEDLKNTSEKWKSHHLELQDTEHPDLKVGYQRNERKYSVRTNRERFFFPDEWKLFLKNLDNKNQARCYDILINTGVKYKEAKNIKKADINFEEKTITIKRIKLKKGEEVLVSRTFKLSSQFLERLKTYTKDLQDSDTIPFLTNSCLNLALKRLTEKIGFKDPHMFAVENLRKTHSIWLKSLGMNGKIIFKRLGMSMKARSNLYNSSEEFSKEEKQEIRGILGDLEV